MVHRKSQEQACIIFPPRTSDVPFHSLHLVDVVWNWWLLPCLWTQYTHSLIPRPLPDFILQLYFYLHSCVIKSWSGLGTRLACAHKPFLVWGPAFWLPILVCPDQFLLLTKFFEIGFSLFATISISTLCSKTNLQYNLWTISAAEYVHVCYVIE